MAINNINTTNSRLQNSNSSQNPDGKSVNYSSDNKASAIKSDSVYLTSEAKSLHKMYHTLDTAPTDNESRVENIKKSIANGDYKVNADTVAKKMFSFEAELTKSLE
ncbi:flagellar biosynthesis anti-sigma factor FlgM [Aeromonas cavernicola]|uniref:Negative regulator of flagellin synthesis n=1 Tax=Aeromonas cavernicola TaxID=1006623 RepID=A0A2H9U8C2_9GAMM|nr:flagellar biosynthesis anti-sigma factor FlgM [Aeromonas cavernicola]PJG60248.1 flagellar biosynthesis anti-sigma factor FlgM [Aeromonas cavernicola]